MQHFRICHTTDSKSEHITQVETGCFSVTMPTTRPLLYPGYFWPGIFGLY